MIRYKVSSLVEGRRKGTSELLPPIEERLTTVVAYLKALRAMNRRLITEVRDGIIPAYRVDRLTRDVDQNTFNNLRALAAALSRITGQTVERILRLESVRHTETFMKDARQTLGIDLSAVVKQEDLEEYLRRAVARNTSLITSVSDDMVKRIEQTVIANEINGRSVKALKTALVEQFGIVDRRAQLIARDQTAKLNSDLNKIRQQQAGIDEYEWMTSGDERVRKLHKSLSGNRYKWDESTGAEGGLPPGQPIQCRCVARAVVSFEEKKKKTVAASPTTLPDPVAIVARSNAEAKSYVLDNGRKNVTEYLTAIDDVTGAVIDRFTSGNKSHVGFTPELTRVFNDPTRSVTVHHNHPSSMSFSLQDILELTRRPGISGIWAHGHNGSSYFATASEKARENIDKTWKAINTIENRVRNEIQPLVYPKQEINSTDAGKMHAHLVMRLIEQKGLVGKYEADLQGETKDAIDRHSEIIDKLFDALKAKRK